MTGTDQQLFRLAYDAEPGRVIRVRVEGPRGFAEGGTPLPHVIVVHGFKGFMHWGFFPELSRRLAGAGFAAVSFNTSGSGVGDDLETFTDDEGFARATYTRDLADLDRVRAHVRSGRLPGVDPERGAVLGHSRGGGEALIHAAEHGEYRAVVTWAAIDSVDRFGELTKAEWRERGFLLVHNARTGQDHRLDLCILEDAEAHRARLDVGAACERLQAPTLLVHGTEDEAVHPSAAETLFARLPEATRRLFLVEDTGHTFGAKHPFAGTPPPLERVFAATLEHLSAALTGAG